MALCYLPNGKQLKTAKIKLIKFQIVYSVFRLFLTWMHRCFLWNINYVQHSVHDNWIMFQRKQKNNENNNGERTISRQFYRICMHESWKSSRQPHISWSLFSCMRRVLVTIPYVLYTNQTESSNTFTMIVWHTYKHIHQTSSRHNEHCLLRRRCHWRKKNGWNGKQIEIKIIMGT